MSQLPEFCRQCLRDYEIWQGQQDARARQLQQLSGVTLGQGRTGYKNYIRVRRSVTQMGPRFWNRGTTRALQEDAAVRLHTSTASEGW